MPNEDTEKRATEIDKARAKALLRQFVAPRGRDAPPGPARRAAMGAVAWEAMQLGYPLPYREEAL